MAAPARGPPAPQYLKRMGYRALMTRNGDRGLALCLLRWLLVATFQEKAVLGIAAGIQAFQSVP